MNEKHLRAKPPVDWQKLKFIALWVFAIGLVAHGYCYFNGNFSHDSLYSIYEQSPELMISVGRYLRPVYRLLRGNFTLPVINGFLSLCFLSLSAYLLTDILDIQEKPLVALTCGILTANATVALMNASYLHDADSYGLALLLALSGAWVSLRFRRGIYYSTLFYFASLGIYQAYIDVAIYVFLLLALVQLLRGERVKKVYLQTLRYFLPIMAGMVLYYLGILLTQHFTHLSGSSSYNTLAASGGFSLRSLAERLVSCFQALRLWLLAPAAHARGAVVGVNLLMLVLSGALTVAIIRRRHLPASSVWGILGIVAAIPLGINAITLLSNIFHWLTIYAFFLSYLWVPVLMRLYSEIPGNPKFLRLGRRAWAILAAVLIFDSCLYSNEAYLKKELESAATLSTFTRIMDRMEQTEGYVPGQTEIAFAGLLYNSPMSEEKPGFDYSATGLWSCYSTTSYETYTAYLRYYLGYPAKFVDTGRIPEYEQLDQVVAMRPFPAADSIQMIDGVLVIKLADTPEESSTDG